MNNTLLYYFFVVVLHTDKTEARQTTTKNITHIHTHTHTHTHQHTHPQSRVPILTHHTLQYSIPFSVIFTILYLVSDYEIRTEFAMFKNMIIGKNELDGLLECNDDPNSADLSVVVIN
jgi:hypothetical protein